MYIKAAVYPAAFLPVPVDEPVSVYLLAAETEFIGGTHSGGI